MNKTPDTVEFNQSAAYLFNKALENRRHGRHADCLKLLNSACGRSDAEPKYLIEAAISACDLNMPDAAGEYITRALEAGCPDTAVLLALSHRLRALGRGEEAEQVLYTLSVSRKKDEYVSRAAEEENSYQMLSPKADRRDYRVELMLSKASSYMLAEDTAGGIRRFQRAVMKEPACAEVWGLYGLSLVGRDNAGALRCARKALSLRKSHPASQEKLWRVNCLCAQIYALCGYGDTARNLMKALPGQQLSRPDGSMLIETLAMLGMYREIYDYTCLTLSRLGFDRELLNAKSVAARLIGKPDDEVRDGWQRILELNNADSVARTFLRLDRENKLRGEPKEFVYGLPEEILREKQETVQHFVQGRRDEETTLQARLVAREFMASGSPEKETVAKAVFENDKSAESRVRLCQMLLRPDFSYELRRKMFAGGGMQRAAKYAENHPLLTLAGCAIPQSIALGKSPWTKCLYKNCASYIEGLNYIVQDSLLLLLVSSALADRALRKKCLHQGFLAEAAFAWLYISRFTGRDLSTRICKDYKISPRQLERMLKALTMSGHEKRGNQHV